MARLQKVEESATENEKKETRRRARPVGVGLQKASDAVQSGVPGDERAHCNTHAQTKGLRMLCYHESLRYMDSRACDLNSAEHGNVSELPGCRRLACF